jgi:uncharacterized protein YcfJ
MPMQWTPNGGSELMRAKLNVILILIVAFFLCAISPLPASAVTHRRRHVVYVRHRSRKHQAEIIGGSAAGGALIGGLAGGGKGALIGGAVGAGGGAIYNQATKKKKVVVNQ